MSPTELESIPTKVRESPWWGAWAPAKCGAKISAAGVVVHMLAREYGRPWSPFCARFSGWASPSS